MHGSGSKQEIMLILLYTEAQSIMVHRSQIQGCPDKFSNFPTNILNISKIGIIFSMPIATL